ncbi:MAG TPA: alpha/beta hydrolase [Kofleriaceae bacterium]|nr:alpha/beta hydrolase [Kofleriaceae bacterium]
MPWILAWFGLASLLATAISLWPPHRPGVAVVGAWVIGWLVSELALHWLVVEVAGGAVLIALGGLRTWIGAVGGVALGLSALGLVRHVRLATQATRAVERGLADGLGRGYHDQIPREVRAAYDPTTSWGRLAMVIPWRPRTISRFATVEYARRGKRALRLDLYQGERRWPGPRPVFVYVHGGAWVIGNRRQQGRLTIHELAAAGWLCASIDYRLSPRATFPDHLDDVRDALTWLRAHVAEHGGDPGFIVIGGGSAGAHLASLAALEDATRDDAARGGPPLAGCVAYYGVYDLVDDDRHFRHRAFHDLLMARVVMKCRRDQARDRYAKASPVAQVCASAPPFLLLHGDRDTLAPVSAARRFHAELTRAGVTCAYVELPGAHHAFELFPSLRSVAVVHGVHRFCQWLYARHLERR